MIKKILLINPPNAVEKDCIRRVVTPLGLMYLAAVAEKTGFVVKILDCVVEGFENVKTDGDYLTYGLNNDEIIERIREFGPDLVGITCIFSYLEKKVYDICRLVKSVDKNIITVSGGIHPSYKCETMLNECKELDYIIMSEGEYRFLGLINELNNKKNFGDIDGIGYRINGEVKCKPAHSKIGNLDELPLPARHLIDLEKYIKINKPANPFSQRARSERIFTSRGCPFKCNFCVSTSYWGHVRFRSVENVIGELRILKEKYGIEEIQFSDDNMTINRQRAIDLFKGMKEFKFSWCTPAGIMLKTLDEEMVQLMAESGCYQVTISPESGSQRVIDEIIKKPIDLKSIRPGVDLLHKYNISVHSNFIIGLPGETREELMLTFDFAKSIDVDSAAFFIAVPYEGTKLYEECEARGWLSKDNSQADYKHSNIIIPVDAPEYVMPGDELIKLVDAKTTEFNEWSKQKNPEAWNKKYKQFLEGNKEESEKIMGRVV